MVEEAGKYEVLLERVTRAGRLVLDKEPLAQGTPGVRCAGSICAADRGIEKAAVVLPIIEREAKAPALSLVVVEYYSRPEIEYALRSIGRNEPDAEVIVSSNSNYDAANRRRFIAEFPSVRFLWNERNLGYAGGVNRGLRMAMGPIIGVLNPDVELTSAVGIIIQRIFDRNRKLGVIGPQVVDAAGAVTPSCRRFFPVTFPVAKYTVMGRSRWGRNVVGRVHMTDFDRKSYRLVDWVSGGAMFVRRKALEVVGGMDERYFLYFEDLDWCEEFWRKGWEVAYSPEVSVIHRAKHESTRRGLRGLFSRSARIMLFSYVQYVLKHGVNAESLSERR